MIRIIRNIAETEHDEDTFTVLAHGVPVGTFETTYDVEKALPSIRRQAVLDLQASERSTAPTDAPGPNFMDILFS